MTLRLIRCLIAGSLCLAAGASSPARAQVAPPSHDLVLAAGTTLYDSGLLDSLVPLFERQSGYHVRVVSCGTGQCLRLGEAGDADVLITHAPPAESAFARAGHVARRLVVAWNYFTIAGPPGDPAGVRRAAGAAAALQAIARARSAFISRGDSSGTHLRELALWRAAGGRPAWPAYLESGQGVAATIRLADERHAYILCDRATLRTLGDAVDLVPLRQPEPGLLNVYHVLELTSTGRPRLNVAGARAFADWLLSPPVQDLIARFGVSRFHEPLFTAARGVEPPAP
jgi:tungstate transport system substrate-binding protein